MTVRVWFHKAASETRPWLVAYPDGRVVAAGAVRLTSAVTQYDPQGFLTLPEGPKAIIEGELEWIWETEAYSPLSPAAPAPAPKGGA